MQMNEILILVVAYLIGSIPFGLVIARIAGIGDITKQGSGNIGATNVTRIGGKKLGAATLVLDGIKGIIAILIARFAAPENPDLQIYAAVIAVIGHIFPVFLKFKGGKGVATTLAVVLFLSPVVGLGTVAIWLAVFFTTRISSAAALVAIASMPILAFFLAKDSGILFLQAVTVLSVVVFAKHHQNIARLLNGSEGKFKK
jgi:glycerol-3-phosphate acyltransferase PlsY